MRTTLTVSAAAIVMSAASAWGAVAYNGGTYTQDFDGLAGATPTHLVGRGPLPLSSGFDGGVGLDGWFGANPGGSAESTEFRAHDGSLAGGSGRGVLSLGLDDGAADRALGALSTSNQVNTFGLVLQNTSGQTLTSFTLSYTGEQWRRGNVPSPNQLVFGYAIVAGEDQHTNELAVAAVPALDFAAPNVDLGATEVALDGNAAGNRTPGISATVTDLQWAADSFLVLQWAANDQSGQDDGVAIDDLSFNAAVPEPSSMFGVGMVALAVLRRRRASSR